MHFVKGVMAEGKGVEAAPVKMSTKNTYQVGNGSAIVCDVFA